MNNNTSIMGRIVNNLRRTYMNKLCAIALLICGTVPVMIDGDGTFLLFAGIIAIYMFFAKDNWIEL